MHWSAQGNAGPQKPDGLPPSSRLVIPPQQRATETATVQLTNEPSSTSLQGSLQKKDVSELSN